MTSEKPSMRPAPPTLRACVHIEACLSGRSCCSLLSAGAIPFVVQYTSIDLGAIRVKPSSGSADAVPQPLRRRDIATIELWGAFGGLIGLVVSLRNLVSTLAPVRLQATQLILKLPAGALTALFGVLIFQSHVFSTLSVVTATQLAAYSLVFGLAQEAVTSMVDRQASKLLEKSKTTDEASSSSGRAVSPELPPKVVLLHPLRPARTRPSY